MTSDESILERLLDAPPAARQALLENLCGDDREQRIRVEFLLLAAREASSDAHPAPPTASSTASLKSESKVGRYTLREKLGEGGMGEVWVARQSEPVKRLVALKLIKLGMSSRQIVARFEQERQALAVMDHPNIAKVLDGGLTEDGQPFFVMELVEGKPLTKFCDDAKLTVKQRLELFVPICHAVQHAHQKGIVHRDLKPANILVTTVDGAPTPKVIDFGVAKAVAGKLTEESLSTQFGAVVGTLEYMAPEQAGFAVEDVDTRADVYSLGVILYELLTGLRPFDSRRLRHAALNEMIRVIREEDPPSLASRLSTDDALPNAAAVRGMEPKRLVSLVRGELDWIVQRCLEKDRNRRYETANGLGRDVQRYLADESVEARPVGTAYRLTKFLKRHRGPATAMALVVLSLVGGVVGTAWGYFRSRANERLANLRLDEVTEEQKRTRAERDRAERNEKAALEARDLSESIRSFLQDDLLDQANPWRFAQSSGGVGKTNPTIRELIDRAAARLSQGGGVERFGAQPRVRAEILATLASCYEAIGEYAKALELAKRALKVVQTESPSDETSEIGLRCRIVSIDYRAKNFADGLAQTADLLGLVNKNLSSERDERFEVGLRQLDAWIETAKACFVNQPTYGILQDEIAYLQLVPALFAAGRTVSAAAAARTAIERRCGADDRRALLLRCVAAFPLELQGKERDAGLQYERALQGLERLPPEHRVLTLFPLLNLERLNRKKSTLETRVRYAQRILEVVRTEFPASSPHFASAVENLGAAYRRQGRYAEAVALIEESLRLIEASIGLENGVAAKIANSLAICYRESNRLDDARRICEEAIARQSKWAAADDIFVLAAKNTLALVYGDQRAYAKAIPVYEEVLAALRRQHGSNLTDALTVMYNLAGCYRDAGGKVEAARRLFEEAAKQAETGGFKHEFADGIVHGLIELLDDARRFDAAEEWRRKWAAAVQADAGRDSLAYAEECLDFGASLLERREWLLAERWLRQCQTIRERVEPEKWTTSNSRSMLGAVLLGQKKYSEAEPLLLKGYEGMKAREETMPPQRKVRLTEAADRLIELYTAIDKPDELKRWKAERAKYPPASDSQKRPAEKR